MGPNGLIVSWSDPCDEVNCNDDRTAEFYEIFYQSAQDGYQILTVFKSSARSAIITNFKVNTRYSVSIRTTSVIDTTLLETRRYIRSDRTDPILALTGDFLWFSMSTFLTIFLNWSLQCILLNQTNQHRYERIVPIRDVLCHQKNIANK